MSTSILHLFFFTCFLLLKMHYLDHILECPIGPSLKVVQLRRLFDWTNMAADLPQFLVVVVLRSPIHANEPSEYNGMLYRTSNRVLNNGIKVIILICMDGTSQYHHHPTGGSGGIEKSHSCKWAKWIQWHALPHIQQSTQQWNKGYYPNLHGWDFSIPPSPFFGAARHPCFEVSD